MSKIDEMIKELCPDGVEMVKLGEVCEILDNQRRPVSKSKRISGIYPYYGANGVQDYINDYIFDGTYLLMGEDGSVINIDKSPILNWAEGKIWVNNHAHVLAEIRDVAFLRYLYYILQSTDVSDIVRGTPPKINQANLWGIEIPLPPLSIQQEIVSVLDSFTTLIDKMKQEVEKRKKQMEYYREKLLSPIGDYEIKTLGEIGTFTRGNGLQKTDFTEEGYPCIHYGQIHTFYGTSTYCTKSFCEEEFAKKLRKAKTGDLLIATTSEDVEACCKATVWLGEGEVAFSGDSYCYSHNQNPKYIAYLFQTEMFAKQKRKVAKGAKVVRVTGESMAEFSFSFPSLEKQSSIVSTLDKFESYISKLEKMIALRQKQYEYYREQLLTFE